ncbi:hypothetical protein KALB_6382 [Kutzneria albida DSM 43870]|uniref:Methyltransferase domain-containing protein n=2 Tax=Kutzneria TaxID=43356 RepID=W5WFX6_9PSEU|nr:hypothetical protein KALB_6382 [Kutzneria albida DSM 43870]
MPRGGPSASWLDRWYETAAPELLDREDVSADRKQAVLRGLNRLNRAVFAYGTFIRWTLAEVADLPAPRVLELGAGHGELSRRLLDRHPRALVTASDIEPEAVGRLRSGPLGRHPRATVDLLDATGINAADNSYDVAVFTQSLHHLPPRAVPAVLSEGARVARTLLVVDAWRTPLMFGLIPLLLVTAGWPASHDGIISMRKMYGPRALHALAARCAEPLDVRVRLGFPGYLVLTARRPG